MVFLIILLWLFLGKNYFIIPWTCKQVYGFSLKTHLSNTIVQVSRCRTHWNVTWLLYTSCPIRKQFSLSSIVLLMILTDSVHLSARLTPQRIIVCILIGGICPSVCCIRWFFSFSYCYRATQKKALFFL